MVINANNKIKTELSIFIDVEKHSIVCGTMDVTA